MWTIWDPKLQKVKAQSEVIFDQARNVHMSCQHESNEIDRFGLLEDEEDVDETDTQGEPLRDQASQLTQVGMTSKSHIHEASHEEADNTHSRRRLQRGQHSTVFGSRWRYHCPQRAPPQRGSDCPAFGSCIQAIMRSTASGCSSSSSSSCRSANRESYYVK